MGLCVCANMCTCVHGCVHQCATVCTCMYVPMYVPMHMCVCMCMHVCWKITLGIIPQTQFTFLLKQHVSLALNRPRSAGQGALEGPSYLCVPSTGVTVYATMLSLIKPNQTYYKKPWFLRIELGTYDCKLPSMPLPTEPPPQPESCFAFITSQFNCSRSC